VSALPQFVVFIHSSPSYIYIFLLVALWALYRQR
jgi:hypothetical protein